MRFLFRLFGASVVLVLVAVAALLLLPAERIALIAADQFEDQTGRALGIEGPVAFSVYPVLGVSVGRLELANAPWSERGPLLRAESASIGLDATALMSGDIKVTAIEAKAPEILLETRADGTANWQIALGGTDQAADTGTSGDAGAPPDMSLDRVQIRGAVLRYVEAGQETLSLRDVDAEFLWPGGGDTAQLDVTLTPAEAPIRIKADLADVKGLIAGKAAALTARITAPGGAIDFVGRAGIAPELAGRLTAKLDDSAAFARALGQGGLSVPAGFGRAAEVTADVVYGADARVSLRNLSAALDQNRLAGDADIGLGGAKPTVTARLSAGVLDLSGVTGSGDDAGGGSGWSKAPIDASGLGAVDGDIALKAKGLRAAGYAFGPVDLQLTLKNARAVVDLRSLAAWQGAVSGKIVANARGGFSARADIAARGIEMQSLLTETAGVSRISGKGNAQLNVLGVGNSTHALMNSLDGSMKVSVGRGKIDGIDLDRLLRGEPGGGTTIFDALSVSGTFAKGVLSSDDLALDLPRVTASGKGRIGIGARDIDYLLTPSLKANDGQGLAVPVRIKGGWSNPKIVPDLEAAAKANFQEEIDKAKDDLQEKAEKKLQKELGVTVEDGESVEDALQKKLDKEITRGLNKLLKP